MPVLQFNGSTRHRGREHAAIISTKMNQAAPISFFYTRKKGSAAVIATAVLVAASLTDLAAGVASTPPTCPVCDCDNQAYNLGRSAPILEVLEEFYDTPSEDYEVYEEYEDADAFPRSLDMGFGGYVR